MLHHFQAKFFLENARELMDYATKLADNPTHAGHYDLTEQGTHNITSPFQHVVEKVQLCIMPAVQTP